MDEFPGDVVGLMTWKLKVSSRKGNSAELILENVPVDVTNEEFRLFVNAQYEMLIDQVRMMDDDTSWFDFMYFPKKMKYAPHKKEK